MLGEVEGDPNRLKNADVPKLFAKKKLDFSTGSKWAYSNTNYLLLSLVVERVTKKSLGKFLRDEVFKPLGMPNATVFESPTAVIPNRASGYGGKGKKLRALHSDLTVTGDGGVMLSLADFEKWIGAIRGKKLAEEKTWDLAMTPGKLDDGRPHSYGFGWLIGKEGGRIVIGHSGSWVGVASDVAWYVEEDLFVVVLTNWNPGVSPAELGRKTAEIWRGEQSK
jgi:CubicO group peptidase (beta-lactamase class C family)